ncbi:hypothetical protein F5972_17940 [Microbispora cellulosiformans]|uniref:Glycosyltransferase RgtA/B/C/D-like domain-containing protein n=1 Tax=Microbispora cellulosiformans TaxID=2614688 RepID=A0A5J5K1B3_9ACTN|nr:hypothetical protein [Microbispora cellulosiformans]KAA9377518.1 hypothetical protein F5972_17940 [Microbispora cellulosiformans]
MEYAIVAVAAATLVFLAHACLDRRAAGPVTGVLLLAFSVRLLIHSLVMQTGLLPYGGDNYGYEKRALEIAAYWNHAGIRFVTSDQLPSLEHVAVPCNIFALVVYLCGGRASLACTSVVALVACALCVVMYRFARVVGADERAAFRLLVLTAFMPAFLLHTADTFKDGFNAFLVVTCLGLAAANARRFDLRKLVLLVPLLGALWNVRPYMVFMCAGPLLFGFVGARRALPLCTLALLAGALSLFVFFPEATTNLAVETPQQQFEQAQSETVRSANADGGSGVVFADGGDPWGAFAPKLLYTLLSPFPWTGGSLVLQLGKIETLLWYYLLFCAVRGGRHLWRHNRRALMLLLVFVVPCTVAYATSMSNIGLIFRQRMPIVMVVSLLSAVGWTHSRKRSRTMSTAASPREHARL